MRDREPPLWAALATGRRRASQLLRRLPTPHKPTLAIQKVCDWHELDTELGKVPAGSNVYTVSAEIELSAERPCSCVISIHFHPDHRNDRSRRCESTQPPPALSDAPAHRTAGLEEHKHATLLGEQLR